VAAIVLGGSRARGTATINSDYDIGLYYSASGEPLDLDEIRRAVLELAGPDVPHTVTEIGEWGRWIVGGAWLSMGGKQVDFLYRNLEAVHTVVQDCSSGRLEVDYQPGHPHCFVSSIWMAEVAYCRVMFDPTGAMGRLKSAVEPYPDGLRRATLARFGWESGFALGNGKKAVSRADHSYIAGCLFRAFACMAHALHALNGVYLMNEKGALKAAADLVVTVPDLNARADEAWASLGIGNYARAFEIAQSLVEDFELLVFSPATLEPKETRERTNE
jgi:hypothetical protein